MKQIALPESSGDREAAQDLTTSWAALKRKTRALEHREKTILALERCGAWTTAERLIIALAVSVALNFLLGLKVAGVVWWWR